ncbi:phage tail tip lysozyme [Pararoseomonas indoligenes]|uniref:DUF2313 domain-containing protein n=1 Tax=Roseomonas indoligenes TaxID=2820811 RepID=A0A940S5F1_9PROT|nr:phage tail tip lysozyme [Pararoseomonas indoligenes]MBP0492880.1 DUF2313 domain-containing protein [Pararoseomonas indoligenes]
MATATAGALSVSISAIDLFTKPTGRMTTSANRLGQSVRRVGAELGRGLQFDRISRGARSAAANIGAIVPPLSAITAAGTVAGVYRLAAGWSRANAELGRLATRTKTAVPDMNGLQAAAQIAGASAEDVAQGMVGLGDAVTDAVGGRDDTAAAYLRMLGISMRDASGRARTAADVLPEVAEGLTKIGDPALQARVMGALRLPPGLIPMLSRGKRGLADLRAEAESFGATSEEGARAARDFEAAQARLNLAGTGLANTFAARLAPALTPALNRFATWISSSRVWLGLKLDQGISAVSGALERAPWEEIGKNLGVVTGGVGTLVSGLGDLAFPKGFGVELEEITRKWGEWVGAVNRFAESPVGRWWFDANAPTPGGGIGSLGEDTTPQAEAEAKQRRAETDGQDYVPRRRDDWIGRPWNWLLDRGRESAERRAAASPQDDTERGLKSWADIGDRLAMLLGVMNRPERVTGMASGSDRRRAQDDVGGFQRRTFGDEEATARQRTAFDRLKGHGWTDEQAAGILANLRHESGRGLDNAAVGDQGKAYGIAQWHADRQENFRRWAGKPIQGSSLEEQIDFINYELTRGDERPAGNLLRRQTTAAGAGQVVSQYYERPKHVLGEANARGDTAAGMLPRLRAAPPAAAPASAGPLPPAAAPMASDRQRLDVRVTVQGQGTVQALMPTGPIWPRALGTDQETVGRGLVPSVTRVCNAARMLVTGAFPGTALQMLPEWEMTLGLPDACTGQPDTLQGRRRQVVARLAAQGGQSRRYFIGQAAQLGYAITIEEFAPARADELVADAPAYDPVWAYTWRVHAPETTVTEFGADESAADEPLAAWGNQALECRLRSIRPGHTTLQFAYGSS